MGAITLTQLANASLDADHIAAIATSGSPTATDRLGVSKKTMAGVIADIGMIVNRGAWTTATAYAIKDIFSNAGTWYITLVGHTSGVFATDLAANKFQVYQGVTWPDLAAPGASALFGFKQSGVGSVTRTVEAKNRERVTVLDKGGAGDNVTDCLLAFANVLADHPGRAIGLPAGNYRVPFTASVALSIAAGTTLEGEGKDVTTITFVPSSTSFRTLFDLLGNGITFRRLKITCECPVGGSFTLFSADVSKVKFDDCDLDGAMTTTTAVTAVYAAATTYALNDDVCYDARVYRSLQNGNIGHTPVAGGTAFWADNGSATSHNSWLCVFPQTGEQTNYDFLECDLHGWAFVVLKANARTSTQRRLTFAHCDCYENYYEDIGFNTPNGIMDDIQVYATQFRDSKGASVGISTRYCAFASATNFRVSLCGFKGVITDALHIEEASRNFSVTTNTFEVDGTAIFLVDNNIAGSFFQPSYGTIGNNTLIKAGTQKQAGKHGIWLGNNGAGLTAARGLTIESNVVVGFEMGVISDMALADAGCIRNNLSEGCFYGYRASDPSLAFSGNTSKTCDFGVFCSNGGVFENHTFIDCTLPAASATVRPVALINPGFTFAEFSVGAGASVYKALSPILANARVFGHLNIYAFCEALGDTAVQADEVSYDGATFSAINKTVFETGGVQVVSVKNGSNFAVQVFSASARTTMRLNAKLNGTLSVASS